MSYSGKNKKIFPLLNSRLRLCTTPFKYLPIHPPIQTTTTASLLLQNKIA
jgi:hypothetical protein